jgi:hypothetical protein
MINTRGDSLLIGAQDTIGESWQLAAGTSDPNHRSMRISVVRLALAAAVVVGCGTTRPPTSQPLDTPIIGRTADGTTVTVSIAGESIASLAPSPASPTDAWLVPALIDSHVHLALFPVADALAARGIAAAVDLAAPVAALAAPSPITLVHAGPMITRPDGYPLNAWGAACDGDTKTSVSLTGGGAPPCAAGGYGIGCEDAACVERAVADLAARGARAIKIPVADDGLDPSLIPVAVTAAHRAGLVVAAHALDDRGARIAGDAGCDVLAHTPLEPLSDETIAVWRTRAVISTLAAFGGGPAAIDNLRRLRAAGVVVLYGTDMGNLRDAGPSGAEIELLGAAGLDAAAIVDAMTAAPATFWKLDRLGAIASGRDASLLVVTADPRRDATAVLRPRAVYLRGKRVAP